MRRFSGLSGLVFIREITYNIWEMRCKAMKHEAIARTNHKSGCNCAQSVFAAFAEELGVSVDEAKRMAPRPRSEGGKCGAFLAARALLRQLRPEAAEAFERRFADLNGMTECSLLVKSHDRLGKSCNDYVGDAARLADEALGN